jgi:hypothetical protein
MDRAIDNMVKVLKKKNQTKRRLPEKFKKKLKCQGEKDGRKRLVNN